MGKSGCSAKAKSTGRAVAPRERRPIADSEWAQPRGSLRGSRRSDAPTERSPRSRSERSPRLGCSAATRRSLTAGQNAGIDRTNDGRQHEKPAAASLAGGQTDGCRFAARPTAANTWHSGLYFDGWHRLRCADAIASVRAGSGTPRAKGEASLVERPQQFSDVIIAHPSGY